MNCEFIDRWHNLTIVHEKVKVEFYLDGVRYIHETVNDVYYLGLDPYIYIGGGKNFVQTLGRFIVALLTRFKSWSQHQL